MLDLHQIRILREGVCKSATSQNALDVLVDISRKSSSPGATPKPTHPPVPESAGHGPASRDKGRFGERSRIREQRPASTAAWASIKIRRDG